MPQLGIPGGNGPSFELLQQKLQENTLVDAVDLKDGRVPERADILKVEDTMVLDTQNAPLPIPTERDVGGGIKVRQIRLMDYPFFAEADKDTKPSITSVIGRSPESARLILIGAGTFLSDDVLEPSSVDRTQYLAPVDFAQNLVDWSLEDRALLALRTRGGQFSRTLVPMEAGGRCSGSI
jgi:hypothetical protein